MRTDVTTFQIKSLVLAFVAGAAARTLPLDHAIVNRMQASNVRVIRHSHYFVRYAISFVLKRIIRFADCQLRLQNLRGSKCISSIMVSRANRGLALLARTGSGRHRVFVYGSSFLCFANHGYSLLTSSAVDAPGGLTSLMTHGGRVAH